VKCFKPAFAQKNLENETREVLEKLKKFL